MMIPFPPWEPDRADYAPSASPVIVNALPTRDGWGPLPDLTAFTQALPSENKGAVKVRTSTGAYRIIAGTETGLYELDTTDYSWTDLTGPSGPYSVPAGDIWAFEIFGDNLVAVNLADDPQYIDINSGTAFADVPGSPPRARYISTAGEYLVLGHIVDQPNRVHVSAIGDMSNWTVGEAGCDFQDFPDGEEVMGVIGAERGAIIFQRTKIRRLDIAQSGDYSFTTQVINPDRGTISPRSITQIGPGQFFYYSTDGFCLGVEGRKIGAERVDGWFQSTFDSIRIGEISSVADPFNKIVWSQAEMPTGDKFLVGYNWQLDRWCYADNNVSQMMVLTTPGITWDGLDNLYSAIDDVNLPFDDAIFAGGSPRFGGFTTDNKLGFFTGQSRGATLETADIEMTPGARSFLREARVYTDATDFTLKVGTMDYHGGVRSWSNIVTPFSATRTCHFRHPGRLHRFRMELAEGETWSQVTGLNSTFSKEGMR